MTRNDINHQNKTNYLQNIGNNDIFCLNQLTESVESIPSNPFNLELFTHSSNINNMNINMNINMNNNHHNHHNHHHQQQQSPSLTAESPEYFDLDILQGLEFIPPLSSNNNSEVQTVSVDVLSDDRLLRDTGDTVSVSADNISSTKNIKPSIWKFVPHEIEYGSRKNMEREKFNHPICNKESKLMLTPSSSIKKTTNLNERNKVDTVNEHAIKEHTKIALERESLVHNKDEMDAMDEIEIAFMVSNTKDIDLNGLYTISGFRNGHVKYTKCIGTNIGERKTTIYCNPKRGWTISNHKNIVKYYSYPITKQPPYANWISNKNNDDSCIIVKSSKNYGYNIIDLLFTGYINNKKLVSLDIIDIFYKYLSGLIYDNCDNCKRECENVNLCGFKWLCKECNVEAMF